MHPPLACSTQSVTYQTQKSNRGKVPGGLPPVCGSPVFRLRVRGGGRTAIPRWAAFILRRNRFAEMEGPPDEVRLLPLAAAPPVSHSPKGDFARHRPGPGRFARTVGCGFRSVWLYCAQRVGQYTRRTMELSAVF